MRGIRFCFLGLLLFSFSFLEAQTMYQIDENIFINKNGKLVESPNIETSPDKDSELKEYLKQKGNYEYVSDFVNGYSYVLKQIQDDFYIPYYENGELIPGATLWVSGSFGGLINRKGDLIIPFTLGQYTEVHDNLVRCREKYLSNEGESLSLYGYKNLKNQWIIAPQYAYADDFRFGLAEVSIDEKDYFLIDKNNNVILKNNYKFIYVFTKNRIIVSNDREHFYITNLKGSQLSEVFNLIEIIDNEMIMGDNSKGKFYMNTKGNIFYFSDYIK